jgi:hypothetical protein
VYLHGLLPERVDESALNRLVLTSGDFGLAYLTERWAARFVSELFRNYVVCFVGYSISDPVLRYMMDALAADRDRGEPTPEAFAFADFNHGRDTEKTAQWKSRGVTPILYQVPTDDERDHSALHHTLIAWADTYRDGVLGKERLVLEHALARPSASTVQDDFVGRMLWALSDDSGLPARRFAEFDPAPPLEWLDVLSQDRFRQGDLRRFRAPATDGPWDAVVEQLSRWLMRHIHDPTLLLWLTERGGRLHDGIALRIEQELGLGGLLVVSTSLSPAAHRVQGAIPRHRKSLRRLGQARPPVRGVPYLRRTP